MTRTQPEFRQRLTSIFASAKGNWDLFVVFIERGMRLLADKGIITYIVPNKLIGAPYSETLRKMILGEAVLGVRDYSAVKVFKDVDVYPIVFLIQKAGRHGDVVMEVMHDLDTPSSKNEVPHSVFYSDICWDRYFQSPETLGLLLRLAKSPRLERFFPGVSSAATVSEAYDLQDLIREYNGNLKKPFKKLVNTGTIDRYVSLWSLRTTRYIKHGYTAPIVLDADLMSLSQKRLRQAQSTKLIIGGMNKILECFYDQGECLAGKSTVLIPESGKFDIKLALAILNSSLTSFWYRAWYRSLSLAGGYLRISANEIKTIPLPVVEKPKQVEVIVLVDKILAAKAADPAADVAGLEHEIDLLVYRLYGLTPEEIAIVEGNSP